MACEVDLVDRERREERERLGGMGEEDREYEYDMVGIRI